MRRLKATFVVIAVLIATVSVSAFARGHSGAGRSHGSHASSSSSSSSGGVGFGSIGSHGYSGVRAPATHVAPPRHFAGSAGVAVVVGVPLYAPLLFPAPGYDYSPSPTYIEQAPGTGYWYFCPQSNAYYPYVQECPGGWQPVLPQPPG